MAQLKEVGAKLSDLRFQSSINAFVEEERQKPEVDPLLDAAVADDPSTGMRTGLLECSHFETNSI